MKPIERRPRIALFIAMLLMPAIARAHLTDTGLGPIYDGIAHVLMSFDDLLAVVALALVAGLSGAREGRLALFTLPVAWLLGGAAGASLGAFAPPSWAPALSLLGLGVLTAASVRLAPSLVVALSAALGVVHGSLNGAGIADAGRDATGLLGIVATVFVVLALVTALVVSLRKPWTRIAVRVAGSWVAAVGLLMAGWGIRAALA